MNEKITTIREACIKANPEIIAFPRFPEDSETRKVLVELYKISGSNHITKEFVETATIHLKHYEEERMTAYVRELEGEYPSKRPIRLADVLHTLGVVKPEIMVVEAKEDGVLAKKEFAMLMCDWKFTRDSLMDQSEDTIDFIYNLLK